MRRILTGLALVATGWAGAHLAPQGATAATTAAHFAPTWLSCFGYLGDETLYVPVLRPLDKANHAICERWSAIENDSQLPHHRGDVAAAAIERPAFQPDWLDCVGYLELVKDYIPATCPLDKANHAACMKWYALDDQRGGDRRSS